MSLSRTSKLPLLNCRMTSATLLVAFVTILTLSPGYFFEKAASSFLPIQPG